MESIQNRYDFVILFDVRTKPEWGSDAGNLPRVDAEQDMDWLLMSV